MYKKKEERGISFVAGVLAVFFLGIFTALIIAMYVYQANILESDIIDVKFAIVKDSLIVEDGVLKFELKNIKNAENISGVYILVKDSEGNEEEVNVSGSIDKNGSRGYIFNFEKIGLKDVYFIAVAPIINYNGNDIIGRIRVLYREGKEVEDKESDSPISKIINILNPKNQTTPPPSGGGGGGGGGSGSGGGGGGGGDSGIVAPSNLAISSQTDLTVSLAWEASSGDVGVVGYRIYRNGILIGTSTTTSFTDDFSEVGEDQTPPTPPSNLAISSQTDSSVTLIWGASTDDVGVTEYNVYRDGTGIGTSVITSFTDDFVDSPIDLTPPTAPIITTSSSTEDSVSLGWTASTDDVGVVGYKIYRDGVLIGDVSTTSFVDDNVIAGNTYSYYIIAYDASGKQSLESNTVSVKVEAPTGGLSISRLVLVNADTEAEISNLTNGYEINFENIGTQNVNIRADVTGSAGSVRFNLDGNTNYHIENSKPYFIGGDTSGNANAWTPTLGSHTLIVTPYAERSGVGTPGTAKTVTFTVTGTPSAQCTDSDGGNNRYIKGTVTYGSESPAIFEDVCLDSSTLREGFCSSDSLGTQDITCSAGCSNGACISVSGDKPGPSNTGPSNPTLLRTYTGPLTITTPGTVIENAIINDQLTIEADNVIVRNFKITTGNRYGIRATDRNKGIIIEDGEISGMISSGIWGEGLTARRLNIHHSGSDGIKGDEGDMTVENSWIHHLGLADDSHADGIQVRIGSNYVFRGNNFDMPKGVSGTKSNSPIFVQSAEGPVNDVLVESNWINGGNFGIHMDDGVSGMVIRNNLWGNDCKYGIISLNGGNPVWENNRWEATGETITLSQATNNAGAFCDEGA